MAILMTPGALAMRALVTAAGLIVVAQCAVGGVIVNPPLPIEHRVDVQIIQTSLDGGLLPSTVFGNSTQQAAIEAIVDQIWAQAGIDIRFLPSITPYADSFANTGALLPRPTSDLGAILVNAASDGVLHSDPEVLNMFFVAVAPGFGILNPNTTAGVAKIGASGIAVFNGEKLPTIANGQVAIAGVVAHEIGHNLGLVHTTTGSANLMAPKGTTDQLTPEQIATALNSRFVQSLAVPGDFNGDGVVDGADLGIWRAAYGVNARGDADADGDTDGRDFLVWQKNFDGGRLMAFTSIPEPSSGVLVIVGGAILVWANPGSRRYV